MAIVCKYNKYGYCRFKEHCRNYHVKDLCETKDCEIESCNKRHPKICSYYQQYRRCKFGSYCAYRHISYEDTATIIDDVKRKIDDLLCQINDLKLKKLDLESTIGGLALS